MSENNPTIYKFDYLVFIGRFQIVHKAHINIILEALKLSERVIVVCGSAFQPRTTKNPFIVSERWMMIQNSLAEVLEQKDLNRVMFTHCYDYTYNDQKWVEEIQLRIQNLVPEPNSVIGIIGHKKDRTSFYLDLFPQWEVVNFEQELKLDATKLREDYFNEVLFYKGNKNLEYLSKSTIDFLEKFKETEDYKYVLEEFKYIKRYKEEWSGTPYEVVFTTTDSVVIQSGHVLLVTRRTQPGKGLHALPGGFLKTHLTLLDSMLEELKEETRIKCPIPVIKGCIKDQHVFDSVSRSIRGRTLTHAYLIDLTDSPPKDGGLYRVKGGDDAQKAFWIPISEIDNIRDTLFEDHADIIKYFIGRI